MSLGFVSAEDLDRVLDPASLVEALAAMFASSATAPPRHHHAIADSTHLLMPAWTGSQPGTYLGTKIVNVFPTNGARGLPAVQGVYVLQSGETGAPLAVLEGTRLTALRTAAASALAARFLAREDAAHLLVVGAGALAPHLIRAHAAVRPIRHVTLWNHRREGAERLAARLAGQGLAVDVADDLETAVGAADIVSCATLSPTPLVRGAWLKPGTHLDLVGAFTMAMREADDDALLRSRIYIDTQAALDEGGDVAVGIASGIIARSAVQATLADLCLGRATGRETADEITLFKSVGSALEDLAAAILAYERSRAA